MYIIPQDNQLSFTVNISRFRRGPIVLALFNSDFRKAVMPENVESMWGPIPFKALPPGTENKCDVASHRLVKAEYHDWQKLGMRGGGGDWTEQPTMHGQTVVPQHT